MRVRLGITTTFAVKRWPRPADWAPIVRGRLGAKPDLDGVSAQFDVFLAQGQSLAARDAQL